MIKNKFRNPCCDKKDKRCIKDGEGKTMCSQCKKESEECVPGAGNPCCFDQYYECRTAADDDKFACRYSKAPLKGSCKCEGADCYSQCAQPVNIEITGKIICKESQSTDSKGFVFTNGWRCLYESGA